MKRYDAKNVTISIGGEIIKGLGSVKYNSVVTVPKEYLRNDGHARVTLTPADPEAYLSALQSLSRFLNHTLFARWQPGMRIL